MLMVGTAVNAATAAAALIALAQGAPVWLAAVIFFAPLPYNGMLVVSVWRSAARGLDTWSQAAKVCAALWFGLVLLI
jgi:hypothetical protein